MDYFRAEISYPINRDSRSFEQHARDSFNSMQNSLQRRCFDFDDCWYTDMKALMDRRNRQWDDEMRRIREEFFSLSPRVHGGNIEDIILHSPFLLPGHRDSDFAIMPNFNFPRHRTADGTVADLTATKKDQMKMFYDRETDGLVHYKIHFDVKDFKPEDIKVVAKDNKVELSAKSEVKTENSVSSKEFTRIVEVPDNVDLNHLRCTLTSDKILTLDAPVKTPDYEKCLMNSANQQQLQQQRLVLPLTQARAPSPVQPDRQLVLGKPGPSIVSVGDTKKLHLEIAMDEDYAPDEIKVELKGGRTIQINARHEEKSETFTSYREFNKEYGVPETIDANSIRATMMDQVLVIEANVLN